MKDTESMLGWILGCYALYSVIKIYAACVEIGFIKKMRQTPAIILSQDNYEKAASYKIANNQLTIITSLLDVGLFYVWLMYGLSWLQTFIHFESSLVQSVAFVLGFMAINYCVNLPFEIYHTFWLDKAYGFSTIDVKTYIQDHVKSIVMFFIFGGAFFAALGYIITTFDLWWMYGFIFAFAVILGINVLYPIVIVPLFNKLSPLADEHLKESIEALLTKAGLKSSGVFSMDASKRDNRLNAYFAGLGSSKRVVLFDTLIAKLQKHELLAVLGHELGHFKHKDILKNIASSALMLFLMFAFFGNLPETLFNELHLSPSAGSVIIFFLLFSPVLSFAFMPLFGMLSRHNEYKADEYGSECESKEALASALIKLADENKSFPYAHPLSIALYFTHPPLTKRLAKLGVQFEQEKSLAH